MMTVLVLARMTGALAGPALAISCLVSAAWVVPAKHRPIKMDKKRIRIEFQMLVGEIGSVATMVATAKAGITDVRALRQWTGCSGKKDRRTMRRSFVELLRHGVSARVGTKLAT